MISSIIESTEAKVSESTHISLEEWMQSPPDNTEWVDGQLIEKKGITAKTGRIQSRLSFYWRSYIISNGQGGEVYTETSCRTVGRGRCPDVSYLIPELVVQFGEFTVLPQSFSLIAEIISPTDDAEEVFTKVNEYLQSGCQEVWLVLPESKWIVVITQEQRFLFTTGEVVSTQKVLQGFNVAVDELLA
ncbi:Uma2 family endonuclease [Coleofasciculus sp. FACHB-64]|uniref:Uma2 family endonuclease n=1 Tax=Cyanophyceae TaxID=3028117 RepID=UPI0016863FBB|nr:MULTISPECIES: Uma2 family endonuclease [unclassified Coleofasciculus]MBD1877881.1 Uma2 family endonuclease [Coleofasciculus sp. FACHB-T130]MBD2046604.1 Uma2 family endonuclease [Coleofasciculus sp. FACHB-64]MBD2541680.1 Uma2 family endonuclease [Coleofasciculus sp. FACHB-SPT36]